MPGNVAAPMILLKRLLHIVLQCCVPAVADLAGRMPGCAENGPHNAIPMLPTRTGVFLYLRARQQMLSCRFVI